VTISLLSMLLLGACVTPAIVMKGDLLSFVASLSFASFLAFTVAFCYAIHLATGPRSDRWLALMLIGAFAYLAAVVLIIDHWLPRSHDSWVPDIAAALGKWGLSLVLLPPLFLFAERHLRLLPTVLNLARSLRNRTT